jgi:hypothetical protein
MQWLLATAGWNLAWLERAELALWESDSEARSAAAAEGLRWRRRRRPAG